MKLEPMGRSILIKLHTLEDELKAKGSTIIIPKEYQLGSALLCEAIILEVGPDVKNCIVGDKIIFAKGAFSSVHTRYGEEMGIMSSSDIVAKITERDTK